MHFAHRQILVFLPLSHLTHLKTTCFSEQWFVYIRDGFVSLSHIDTASFSIMITKLLIEAHAEAFQTHDETAHNTGHSSLQISHSVQRNEIIYNSQQ